MTPDAGIALAADPCDWSALAVATTTLPGGVRVLLVENHSVPLVFLSWTSPAGFECDPLGLEGIASLTPLLFREGSARRSAGQIAQQLDDLGAELASGSEWEGASLNLGLLSSDLFTGVELLLDMATTARFPDAAIARVRQRRLAEIEGRRRDPRAQANDELARALFGSTMYGRPPLGTVASVERIDADAIAAFHDARYRPDTSCLVIAGDVDGETALDRLATIASPRTTADRDTPDPLPSAAAIGIDPAEGLRTVHVAHATQTEIRVGHASVGRDSEDLPALDVLGTILGGGPTSRLARRLRQQAGLTYHVRSRFIGRRLGGMFVVETRVAHDATARALAGIREEIARLCEERVSGAEIEQARQSLFLAERRRFQDLIGTGSTLGAMALRGDPVRQLERTARAMAAVEPESLRELAGRCLKPGGLVAVVAGPEAPH